MDHHTDAETETADVPSSEKAEAFSGSFNKKRHTNARYRDGYSPVQQTTMISAAT